MSHVYLLAIVLATLESTRTLDCSTLSNCAASCPSSSGYNTCPGSTGSGGSEVYYCCSACSAAYSCASNTALQGCACNPPALTPWFGATTATADGFTAQISNYATNFAWAGTATASGTVVVSDSGLVTVTGVAPATASTATITTARSGYTGGTASVTQHHDAVDLDDVFGNVTAADGFRYDLKDSAGYQMDCMHVLEAKDVSAWGGSKYFATYHTKIGSEYEVRLSRSSNLLDWTFVRAIISNADMPYMSRPVVAETNSDNQWILLTHEQWMTAGSRIPSRLGFKLYSSESDLAAGNHFNSYIAPLTVGQSTTIEGTPSIYESRLVLRNG
jgi:hypothetical protein